MILNCELHQFYCKAAPKRQ